MSNEGNANVSKITWLQLGKLGVHVLCFYVVIVILYVLLCCHVRRNKDTHYSNLRKRFSCIKWARSLFTIIIGTFLKETDDNDRRAILLLVMDLVIVAATWLHRRDDIRGPCETSLLRYVLVSDMTSDVNKTTRFKTKAKTKTEKFGLKTKTKTIGPGTTYSIPTVNEIIFYSTIFYNLCTLSTS